MEQNAKILSNVPIAKDVFKMVVETDIAPLAKPGQFVEVGLEGFFLRRPISISDSDQSTITLVYKVVGKGTLAMANLSFCDSISLLGPLGQGFPVEEQEKVLLVGGGVGVPPLLKTAKAYLEQDIHVDVVLGFGSACDVFYLDAFEQLGLQPIVASMDGTAGIKGTVLDAIEQSGIETDFILACGPLPMLKALSARYDKGYVSLEARMACGLGVCMGCVVQDHNGNLLRVCKDGPVFPVGKVVL